MIKLTYEQFKSDANTFFVWADNKVIVAIIAKEIGGTWRAIGSRTQHRYREDAVLADFNHLVKEAVSTEWTKEGES